MGRARWKYITEGYREALGIPWADYKRWVPAIVGFVSEHGSMPSRRPLFYRAITFEGAVYIWDAGAWTRADVMPYG